MNTHDIIVAIFGGMGVFLIYSIMSVLFRAVLTKPVKIGDRFFWANNGAQYGDPFISLVEVSEIRNGHAKLRCLAMNAYGVVSSYERWTMVWVLMKYYSRFPLPVSAK